MNQFSLFGPVLPEGAQYHPEAVTAAEQAELVARIGDLPMQPFEFQGYLGKRRVTSFGWQYDFVSGRLEPADPIPDYLRDVRERVGSALGMDPAGLEQVLITEYQPGAGIGWHKDRPVFGEVAGLSLLSPCTFRFRRPQSEGWKRVSVTMQPRSAYRLSGASRTAWEHSIPAVDALRYSLTFRTLKLPPSH